MLTVSTPTGAILAILHTVIHGTPPVEYDTTPVLAAPESLITTERIALFTRPDEIEPPAESVPFIVVFDICVNLLFNGFTQRAGSATGGHPHHGSPRRSV